jgi:transposase
MRRKARRIIYVGVDVSKDKLDVSWLGLDGGVHTFQVANDEAGHRELVGTFSRAKVDEVRVVLEATGPYGTVVARFLCAQPERIKVMVVQPAAGRQFARAAMRRAKTDRVDADVLREFAQRMEFVPAVLPPEWVLHVRALSRHMCELIDRRAAVKNQAHALKASGTSPAVLVSVLEREEAALTALVDELEKTILTELGAHPEVATLIQRLTALQGVKDRVIARLLPELLAIPRHLSPREVVAYMGLDPRPKQSGQAGAHGSWHISKQGNARVRRTLYLVALTAIRHLVPARAVYQRLRQAGKLKKVAIVAVMRKLLTAFWVMLARNEAFNDAKFTVAPPAAAA